MAVASEVTGRRLGRDAWCRCGGTSPGWPAARVAIAEDEPMPRSLLTSLVAAALFALPATASAADTVVVPDPAAQQITALGGQIVWVTGAFGHQRLMQRGADGTISAVKGTREARSYPSIDLGLDSAGRLQLTYMRCDAGTACQVLWNDLDGRRATFRNLAIPGCTVSTAPSQWRTRIAYGLFCKGSAKNRKLSGLYVKSASRKPVRLPRPKDAVRFGITGVGSVDLRGDRVAATAVDIYQYSYVVTTGGKVLRSFLAAASEGESDAHARGLSLENGLVSWTLTNAEHTGDPLESIVLRQAGNCLTIERLVSPPGTQEFLATDIAADDATLYLLVPGTGIVIHTFTPAPTPTC